MKKISEGYFYEVFELENGRVFKRKRLFLRIAENTGGLISAFRHTLRCQYATREIRKRLPSLPPQLLGNPVFKNKTDYEQDKVTLLMDYFDTHNLEQNKSVVDKYFALTEKLLSFGIHDNVYKFKNSYGIDKHGEVVFIDFNEVTFTRGEVFKLAQEKRWQTEAQFTKFPEGELKEYLKEKFSSVLTAQNIERLWPSPAPKQR